MLFTIFSFLNLFFIQFGLNCCFVASNFGILEAEVNPKSIRVILMTGKERGAVTGSIETEKGAGIRISETGKGQGNPGNGIEKAGPSNLRTAINPNWRCCFNIRFCFICRRPMSRGIGPYTFNLIIVG